MGIRHLTSRKLVGWTLAIAWATAAAPALYGSGPYLPRTGPTVLRFELAMTRPPTVMLPPLTTPEQPQEDSSATARVGSLEAPAPVTTPPAEAPAPASASTNEAAAVAADASNGQTNLAALPSSSSASDSLVVTPEMLVQYFQPTQGTTNPASASVFVPVSVGFTPPRPKSPTSSEAIYRTQ